MSSLVWSIHLRACLYLRGRVQYRCVSLSEDGGVSSWMAVWNLVGGGRKNYICVDIDADSTILRRTYVLITALRNAWIKYKGEECIRGLALSVRIREKMSYKIYIIEGRFKKERKDEE